MNYFLLLQLSGMTQKENDMWEGTLRHFLLMIFAMIFGVIYRWLERYDLGNGLTSFLSVILGAVAFFVRSQILIPAAGVMTLLVK
jgi:hypothetical protein